MTQRAHRDWEEDLAKLIGDPLAFQIGYRVRQFKDQTRTFKQDSEQMLSEYIRYELNLVPSQAELSAHAQAVCELESRVAALETRLSTLLNAPDQV